MRILNSCAVQQDSISTPGCAPTSPAALFLCSIARIRQDISAVPQSHFAVVNCWRIDECVWLPSFNAQRDIFAIM